MGAKPPAKFVAAMVAAAAAQFPRFLPQHFANCIVALTRLGYHPGQQWIDSFFESSAPKLAHFKPQVRGPGREAVSTAAVSAYPICTFSSEIFKLIRSPAREVCKKVFAEGCLQRSCSLCFL